MRYGIAAVVFATGCFSVPPYQPEVSVSYTQTGTGGTAAGPGFALRFADGDGFHFPDALMIDGTDVMGHDPMPSCFAQDELGLLIAPTPRISAHGDAPRVTNHLVPVLRGPGVVQVKLEWATQFDCEKARTPGGTTTFTVFPDGRIVRYDTLVDPSMVPIVPSKCECAPQDKLFNVSTFWTVARARFQSLYLPEMPDQRTLPAPTDTEIANYATVCISGDAYQVAFAWSTAKDTALRTTDMLLGFVRDLQIGASELRDFTWDNSSAIFIEHTTPDAGCKAALARADEYAKSRVPMVPAVPMDLVIDQVATKPAARDGIYGGDDGGDGKLGLPVSDHVELTGVVNSSFAVWLRFPRAVDALRAARDGATGPWYLPQQVDDRSWIVWFRDPISAGQKITIDPI